MKRLLRDAGLVAATALCVWFVRGEAQSTPDVLYGVPMQISCSEGQIANTDISEAALNKYTIWWRPGIGPDSLRGQANLNGCVLYPDLRTPTP